MLNSIEYVARDTSTIVTEAFKLVELSFESAPIETTVTFAPVLVHNALYAAALLSLGAGTPYFASKKPGIKHAALNKLFKPHFPQGVDFHANVSLDNFLLIWQHGNVFKYPLKKATKAIAVDSKVEYACKMLETLEWVETIYNEPENQPESNSDAGDYRSITFWQALTRVCDSGWMESRGSMTQKLVLTPEEVGFLDHLNEGLRNPVAHVQPNLFGRLHVDTTIETVRITQQITIRLCEGARMISAYDYAFIEQLKNLAI